MCKGDCGPEVPLLRVRVDPQKPVLGSDWPLKLEGAPWMAVLKHEVERQSGEGKEESTKEEESSSLLR